jgi:hypothetical protein
MRSRFCSTVRITVSVALVAIAAVALVAAQDPIQSSDTAKAIKELTGEIRTLRTAIERSGEGQLQGQILGLYLSLQQNRVAQANSRLDGVRRELESLANNARDFAQAAAEMDAALSQESDPARRRALEQELRNQKQHLERTAAQEQQTRARETEAYQAAQTEEQRWTELISRLEQLLKK